jgi:hypothetical protein
MVTIASHRGFALAIGAVALAWLGAPTADARQGEGRWSRGHEDWKADLPEQELEEAELFFELNDTDEDLGIHASIDGGPYVFLQIERESRKRRSHQKPLLWVIAIGRLARQGLTQLALESAEPTFDELPPEQFFRRFPEGTYEIEARGKDGQEFEAEVELSHVLAAPPDEITVGGLPAAEDCDDPELPVVSEPVAIDWAAVEDSHPTVGKPGEVEIVRYQLFVERDDVKLGVDLGPDTTEFTVPPDFLEPGTWKFEIIARTSTGNNTAVESCFVVE